MKRMLQGLPWLVITAGVILSPALAAKSVRVHSCSAQPTLSADLPDPNVSFDTVDHIIAAFNSARKLENCDVPLRIDPDTYNAASREQRILLLMNAERRDRGLDALRLDATLLSEIARNHAEEMLHYKYDGWILTQSINAPNKFVLDRYLTNPKMRRIAHVAAAENIARGAGGAARAVYSFMYQGSRESKPWVYRQAVLGYLSPKDGPGHYDSIGIGRSGFGPLFASEFYVVDFLEGRYKPSRARHDPFPIISPPTIVDSNTVQVTNVRENSDGSASGVAESPGLSFISALSAIRTGRSLRYLQLQQATAPGERALLPRNSRPYTQWLSMAEAIISIVTALTPAHPHPSKPCRRLLRKRKTALNGVTQRALSPCGQAFTPLNVSKRTRLANSPGSPTAVVFETMNGAKCLTPDRQSASLRLR